MKDFIKRYGNISVVVIIIIFIIMLMLNYWTPMFYDDYRYHMETKGILTIFADEYHQWLTWTGRSVAHVVLRFLLRFPLIVFDLVSAAAFSYLVLSTAKISQGGSKLSSLGRAMTYLFVFALLWFFMPNFAQVFFWMSGAANYELVMVIMMAFLLVYHRATVTDNPKSSITKAVLMLFLGILSGWCNENTSGAVFLISVGYVLIMKFAQQKKLHSWMFTGLIGNLIGLLIMVSAPGNAIRSAAFPRTNLSLLGRIADGFTKLLPSVQSNATIIFTIAVALLIFCIWQNGFKLNEMISALFLFGGIAAIAALLISPAGLYWSRTYFGGIFFTIVSITTSTVSLLRKEDAANRLGVSLLVSYVGFNFVCGFFTGISDIYQNHISYQRQYDAIIRLRNEGKKDIVAPELTYSAITKYANTDRDDIGPDKNNFRNKQTAKYLGVDSVRTLPKK